ncbi:MdtA/MuxA family multidrug efflux RND transporter periplasmic adaptor subunit [bacterium]|nr:MdtA/MuxA family multidrug efflux RND transporter periplasmic adaptor subunit [bacterium]
MPNRRLTALLRRRWLLLPALAVLALAAYALAVTRQSAPAAGAPRVAPPAPVVAVAARRGDLPVTLDGIGTVTPLASVTVRSRVDGQLMRVHFEEGQMVQAGDLLAEIDPRPFQVQLEQAQGQLARDQALLANANVDLARYKRLVAEDSIPHQQLDTQQALVRQYQGVVQADQAQVDNAQLQLTYARITAPISGRLGLRLVDPGNMVHAADAGGLVVITQMSPIGVVFTIPEDSLQPVLEKVRAGAELPVEAYDRGKRTLLATGSLLTLDNAVDPSTGTVRLKAQFPNDDGALFPNQFVNARLLLDLRRGVTLVPTAAVQRGSQGPFVYVVKADQTAEVRPVTLGDDDGDDTAIAHGLTPGELVVVDGADALRAGRAVSLRTPTDESPKAGT